MSLQDNIARQLQRMLDEMNAMNPLPDPTSEAAHTMGHASWMVAHADICQHARNAANLALLALPDSLWNLVQDINDREMVLLGIRRDACSAQQREEQG